MEEKETKKKATLTEQMAEASHDWDKFLSFVEALYSFAGVAKEDSDTVLEGLGTLGRALKPETKSDAANVLFGEIKEHVLAINDKIEEFITCVLPAIAFIAFTKAKEKK